MIVAIMTTALAGTARAEEVVYKTVLFGSTYNSKGVSSYTASWSATNNGFTVNLANFNNNNNQWSYIKCGSKNAASVATIITGSAIDQAITKVVVTIDAITASNVTSIKLYTSSNNSTWTEAGSFTKATGAQTVTLSSPTANLYYKVECDCKKSSNGILQVSKVEYYYNAGGNPIVATPTFSPAEGVYTSAQNVTISTTTNGATIYYTTDGNEPTTSSSVYSSAIPVSNTTTIKAMATAAGYDNSSVATATYTIVSLSHAGTEADPYTVADARAAIDANVGKTSVYATGVVSEIVTEYSSQYSNITFDIIDEGGSNTLRAYRCTGTDAADVRVGDVVVVSGDLTKYGEIYEFTQDCQLVSLEHSTTPNIVVAETTIEVSAEGVADGSIEVTYNNFTNVLADVAFYEEDGETPATCDWVTASINKDNNNLDYIIEENESTESRTAYLKVYALDDEANNYVYSELITINQAGFVVDYATLPFTFNDGKSAIDNTIGLTQEGLGSPDYGTNNTKLKFDGTGDYVVLKIGEAPGKLSFTTKGNNFSGGTFYVQTSTDGVNYKNLDKVSVSKSSEDTWTYSDLDPDARYIKWLYSEKSQGNVGLGNIRLTAAGNTRPVTVTNAGYATYCSNVALDFTNSDIKAYVGTRSGDKLTFTPITQVPAQTGLLLVCASGTTANVPVIASAPEVENNCLTGVTEYTELKGTDYILNVKAEGAGFFLTGTKHREVKANRAYIPAAVGAGVKSFALDLEDNADGIEETLSDSLLKSENIYNLAGQRLSKMQKGINIVNGKKILK